MTRWQSAVGAWLVIGCLGCGGGAPKQEASASAQPAASGLDAGQEFGLKTAQADLEKAKEDLAKGTPDAAASACVVVNHTVDKLKDVKVAQAEAFVKEGATLCGHDIPLATVEQAVKAAEDARKKDAKGVLSECYNASYTTALELLKKQHASDPAVLALEQRFAVACPKK